MDANAIFDALIAASDSVIRADAIRMKKHRILEVKKRECGHCRHWMKSTCKPENEKGIFKSIIDLPCGDFERTQWYIKFIQKLEEELEEFVNKK